jgi:hypothetical protein
MVVTSDSEATRRSPMFISRKAPVPNVFLAMPGEKHAWPNNAACWSPATPATGMAPPSRDVAAKRPEEGRTSGSNEGGTPNASSSSGCQRRSKMSYIRVREALV